MNMFRNWMGLALLLPVVSAAQEDLSGEVTFITAQHVYVRFDRTEGVSANDTLEIFRNGVGIACLVVQSLSTTSCVCKRTDACAPVRGDVVRTRALHPANDASARPDRTARARKTPADHARTDSASASGERIRGRLSAASYSTLPSERENDHRAMYRLFIDADNIANSAFSAETNINYRLLYPAEEARHPQRTEILNVYGLSVTYAPDSNTFITLGRKINNSASSLGAIDGVQAERGFGRWFAGGILGSRPDIFDYGQNLDLVEYGGYLGYETKGKAFRSRTTGGILQQTNAGAIDRRYTYFQHNGTIKENLNLFTSCSVDLYSTVMTGPRLTDLFISARYRFSKRFDAFLSYDSRKRMVFYETFRNMVETMLDDDDARQGVRLRANYKPSKVLTVGGAYSMRFQADGEDASDNVQLSLGISKAPGGMGRWFVQANRNTSNYLRSDVLSVRHYRTLVPRVLDLSIYYRHVEYMYLNRPEGSLLAMRTSQHYYGADVNVNLARTLSFAAMGELSILGTEHNYRLNLNLTKRFDSRKKR